MTVRQEGFSMVEVLFAMVILTVSALTMAGGTAYVMKRMNMANARVGRVAAVQAASERLLSLNYDALDAACDGEHTLVNGRYAVRCSVEDLGGLKRVLLVSVGPAFRNGRWDLEVADTATVSIAEPVVSS